MSESIPIVGWQMMDLEWCGDIGVLIFRNQQQNSLISFVFTKKSPLTLICLSRQIRKILVLTSCELRLKTASHKITVMVCCNFCENLAAYKNGLSDPPTMGGMNRRSTKKCSRWDKNPFLKICPSSVAYFTLWKDIGNIKQICQNRFQLSFGKYRTLNVVISEF